MNKYFLVFFSIYISMNSLHPSTSTDALGQNIATSQFVSQNKFYVGTNTENDEYSIASVELKREADGNLKATFVSKVPSKGIKLNGKANQSSSMYNQKINKLAIQKTSSGTVNLVSAHNIPDESNASLNSIALIDFSTKSELANTTKINDASGTELKKNDYAALAASSDSVFVAVPPSSLSFGAVNSGINWLKKGFNITDGLLTQKINTQSNAYAILLSAAQTENITNYTVNFATQGQGDPMTFTMGEVTDMWWDTKLNRLYMGLTDVTTTSSKTTAGACSLLVGYINNNQLFMRTIIPLSIVRQPSVNSIICYAATNPSVNAASVFKVRTMHTSTGKDYLIIIGDVSDSGTDETKDKYKNTQVNVYALPLTANIVDSPNLNGLIASRNPNNGTIDFTSAISDISDAQYLMNKSSTSDNTRLTVGVSPQYLVHASTDAAFVDAAITDIQILGDTVFVSLAGSRGAPEGDTAGEAGFFASTAIFSSDGSIRAWTPWNRVVCCANKTDTEVTTDKVSGFGFDKNTSNVWFTTKDSQIATVTLWSIGDTYLHGDKPLSTALKSLFDDDFGIINLINFDDETPGFLQWDPASEYPGFSMLVATGNNKIALIQTGERDENNVFQPTTEYLTDTDAQNIFEFNNDDTNIGFISCAEVSRSNDVNKGWLFIGGNNGLSVIRNSETGLGWTDLYSLFKTDFPTDYSFKILTDNSGNRFTNIIKLIADGTYLYVITPKTIYSITMNANDFYLGKISAINLRSISISTAESGSIFDAMLIDNSSVNPIFALATENGIQIAAWNGNRLDIRYPQNTQNPAQSFYSGPAIKLNFISTQRGGKLDNNKANGNLYVTAFNDSSLNNLYVYRFNLQREANNKNATIQLSLFNEPYLEPGFTTKKYFYKIANFENLEKKLYLNQVIDQTAQQHHFTNSLAITPDPEKFLPDSSGIYKAIDIGIKTNKIPLFGTVTQDTASGTQYIAGSFGLVANE